MSLCIESELVKESYLRKRLTDNVPGQNKPLNGNNDVEKVIKNCIYAKNIIG